VTDLDPVGGDEGIPGLCYLAKSLVFAAGMKNSL